MSDAIRPLAPDERAELEWLRNENALLRTERDTLVRVARVSPRTPTPRCPAPHPKRRDRDPKRRGNTVTERHPVWLTREASDRLRNELAQLRSPEGVVEGDPDDLLRQRRRQQRIRELEERLHHAVVGEAPPDDGIAEPGMVLTVRFDGEQETETFLLGMRDGGGQDELEVYSPDSPLGTALIGARQGERRSYVVRSGATVRVTLVRAVPFGRHRAQPA